MLPVPRDLVTGLMHRVQDGDQDAFAHLYVATSTMVFGMALRVLRNYAQAEEVSQDVYLEAWRTAIRFDASRGSAATWLSVMAHRRAVDCVRSGERASRRDRGYSDISNDTAVADPVDVMLTHQRSDDVRRALDALPAAQREALVLAYFDGRTHREVAEILDVPLGTVKSRIRGALLRLRASIEPELPAYRPSA